MQTRLPEALSIREQFEIDGLIPDDLGDLKISDSAFIHIAHNPEAFQTVRVLAREIADPLKAVLTLEEVTVADTFYIALQNPQDLRSVNGRRIMRAHVPQIPAFAQSPLAWFAGLCALEAKPLYRHFAEQGWLPVIHNNAFSLTCVNNHVSACKLAGHLFTP